MTVGWLRHEDRELSRYAVNVGGAGNVYKLYQRQPQGQTLYDGASMQCVLRKDLSGTCGRANALCISTSSFPISFGWARRSAAAPAAPETSRKWSTLSATPKGRGNDGGMGRGELLVGRAHAYVIRKHVVGVALDGALFHGGLPRDLFKPTRITRAPPGCVGRPAAWIVSAGKSSGPNPS